MHRIFALALMVLVGCSGSPRQLAVGEDACEFCRMVISDDRFGGAVVLSTGRQRTFDAVECLVSYLATGADSALVEEVLVSDFENRKLIPVDSAVFLRSAELSGPMGRGTAAFSVRSDTAALARTYGASFFSWAELLSESDSAASPGHHDHSHVKGDGTQDATIARAIHAAQAGDTVRIAAGVYSEPTIVVDKPLTLLADSGAVLDGLGNQSLVLVTADDVTISGFLLRNTGSAQVEERAAIKVSQAERCRISHNIMENTAFGVYLQQTVGCTVADNLLVGSGGSQSETGNGIHVWSSSGAIITNNRVQGHRDGIYFEFVDHGQVRNNTSRGNSRYGMHFMFSNDCRYEDNHFLNNGNGVAVMYTNRVTMVGNSFERSFGAASYGLLLKDINDSEIRRNRFIENTTALHLEGSNRNVVSDNEFSRNGLAVRLLASAQDNVLSGNSFVGNAFDAGTNSRSSTSRFTGNYWDRYRGYDLDRNGVGDAPFAPVRLFALIVEQSPAALILLRSVFVDLLDLAEKVLPVLTPVALRDTAPLMQPTGVS